MRARHVLPCLTATVAIASLLVAGYSNPSMPRPSAQHVVAFPTTSTSSERSIGEGGRSQLPPTDGLQSAPLLRVGIKPLDPFVVRSGSRYSGFSIELWDEVARRNGWSTDYVWYDTLPPLIDDVSASKLDAGIAGISITQERESRLDFSHPMFNAGLQVLAPQRTDQSLWSRMRGLASASIGEYLFGLLFVMFIAGNIVWFFDRQHRYARGVGRGMFRAAAVGLVGEMGEPSHPVSEVARVVWAVVGICFVSAFTASLTTELTVQQITGSIHGVSDLVDKRVVTVRGSTAGQYLTDRRIDFEAADTAEDAFARLEAGNVDAMVFDAPVLQHHVQTTGSDRLALVGPVFQREDYGIALPAGSTHRKAVNSTLLEMRADGSYDRIYEHYFGKTR